MTYAKIPIIIQARASPGCSNAGINRPSNLELKDREAKQLEPILQRWALTKELEKGHKLSAYGSDSRYEGKVFLQGTCYATQASGLSWIEASSI